jgi:hypothetical protein
LHVSATPPGELPTRAVEALEEELFTRHCRQLTIAVRPE